MRERQAGRRRAVAAAVGAAVAAAGSLAPTAEAAPVRAGEVVLQVSATCEGPGDTLMTVQLRRSVESPRASRVMRVLLTDAGTRPWDVTIGFAVGTAQGIASIDDRRPDANGDLRIWAVPVPRDTPYLWVQAARGERQSCLINLRGA